MWAYMLVEVCLKGSGITLGGIVIYAFYKILNLYDASILLESFAPITLTLLIILMISTCLCLSSNRRSYLNPFCSGIMGTAVIYFLYSVSLHYNYFFDMKNNCLDIVQSSKLLANMIDIKYEYSYNFAYQTLCGPQCECKVKNSTYLNQLKTINENHLNLTFNGSVNQGVTAFQQCDVFDKSPPELKSYSK